MSQAINESATPNMVLKPAPAMATWKRMHSGKVEPQERKCDTPVHIQFSTSPQAPAKNLIFCSIFMILINFGAILGDLGCILIGYWAGIGREYV